MRLTDWSQQAGPSVSNRAGDEFVFGEALEGERAVTRAKGPLGKGGCGLCAGRGVKQDRLHSDGTAILVEAWHDERGMGRVRL
jgi:hypothetical protein